MEVSKEEEKLIERYKNALKEEKYMPKWNYIQNKYLDNKFKDVINFIKNHPTHHEFEAKLETLSVTNEEKEYFKKRRINILNSFIDEFLFYKQEDCVKNPNTFDKEYDVDINGWKVDIKSTRLPKDYVVKDIKDIEKLNVETLIKNLYNNQSKDNRKGEQDRLFIIYYSFITPNDCLKVMQQFEREEVFKNFCKSDKKRIINIYLQTRTAKSTIIFLIEDYDGSFKFFF